MLGSDVGEVSRSHHPIVGSAQGTIEAQHFSVGPEVLCSVERRKVPQRDGTRQIAASAAPNLFSVVKSTRSLSESVPKLPPRGYSWKRFQKRLAAGAERFVRTLGTAPLVVPRLPHDSALGVRQRVRGDERRGVDFPHERRHHADF